MSPDEAAAATKQEAPINGPVTGGDKTQKEHTFHYHWESPRGKVYDGEFTNHILTIKDKNHRAKTTAMMLGGLPVESFSEFDYGLIVAQAHLSVSMPPKERPQWAKDLGALFDNEIVRDLYEEAVSHEATFFGHKADSESGNVQGNG